MNVPFSSPALSLRERGFNKSICFIALIQTFSVREEGTVSITIAPR